MPTETEAAPAAVDAPWDRVCEELTSALACRVPGRAAAVRALGVRDQLGDAVVEFPPGVIPVGLYGHHAVVGPVAPVGGRGCPGCLARRWQAVRAGFLRDALEQGGPTLATGTPPWEAGFVVDALAALVSAADAHPRAPRHPWVWLLDLETLRVARFPLVPDGECPACADRPDDTAEGARIALEPAPEHAPGSFRTRPLSAYDLPLEAFANPVTGMLGPLVAPDLTSASTSSAVGAFTTRSGAYLRECYWGGHTGAYGTSVRVGLLEGLERYAGMRARARRPVVTATLEELGDTAVDPRISGLYPDTFDAEAVGAPRFAPDRPVRWVWGWSLRDDRPVLVPEVVAYYHAPGGIRRRFVQESSNGCASGGSPAEAVHHGLMETIERDAFLLAWFGRARLPEIDPASSTRPATRAMVDRLAMYGYRARFFDTRVSFPVPVVTAVAERVDGGPGLLCFGAGASPDPEDALAGGLCEIATDAVNLRRRTAREERRLRRMAADFDEVRVLHDHPLLYGLPEMGRYTDFLLRGRDDGDRVPLASLAPDRPRSRPADLRADVEAVVAEVTARGFDVVVVDQTAPEQRGLGLSTAKVLVPGLLPIDFGWSRQRGPWLPRTRTALREAGLRTADLPPDECNPAPHPFP
ncbi:ribosomal protein S12 methylthiotransferase accessory factor [Streptomyces sp. BK022]|uniref:TOMM precursor leader peptide-binding protein n=1 Tax=Streptomyces sp. BK022 TaxID=2512123 RepID=UPI00102927F9|nr:TOMM precursor leader peptide-binding protein [Streptomyces sp. BK022]RZU46334.1 ribosomal protein S12 methylthiotransferase accessory factor [Streptomyces sp. BK022]